ncbi:MAG: polyribonucleotide nucleotidyltransferase [bacterium]
MKSIECELGGRKLTIEVNKLAKAADGSALVTYGDTVVLVTTTVNREGSGCDYFPLVVDYRDKYYAAGRFPGGFIKREGAPKPEEILSARLIDRSIRPLFDEDIRNELYIYSTVLSIDNENDPDILGILGASSALISGSFPFDNGPIAGVRIGKIGTKLILNPTFEERKEGKFDIVIAGRKDKITMIEAGCKIVSEDEILEAIEFGKGYINILIDLQKELKEKEKTAIIKEIHSEEVEKKIRELYCERIKDKAIDIDKIWDEISPSLENGTRKDVKYFFEKIEKEIIRKKMIDEGIREDGRSLDEIREINCEVSVLKRTHGSAIFTRGKTQAMAITTLGTTDDEQIIDEIEGKWFKKFMLHYNFPPYSTGEPKQMRAPGRREIGHGALAEKALIPVIVNSNSFPYTIRIVSEILESNGSTSMASVCSGSLSLMDAGVPILDPVSGIAMGLIEENGKIAIFSDITGMEDHIGDMDFKTAGTKDGLTAIQMDVKILGIDLETIKEIFEKAKKGRLFILDKMNSVLSKPSPKISQYAPKVVVINIRQDKIKDLIGPSGKNIKKIIEVTQAKIKVEDDGKVSIFHPEQEKLNEALDMVRYLTEEVEVGKVYKGKVMRVVNFGAFVEILPGQEGLVHISELEHYRVKEIKDVVKEGDEISVKVISIDNQGRINLSKKQAIPNN